MNQRNSENLTGAEFAGNPKSAEQDAPAKPDRQFSPGLLLGDDVAGDLRSRWDGVQAAFVDEPRTAVQQADALVAQAIDQLADTFAEERRKLEEQWDRGDEASTEDLRIALQKYRTFFHRLVAV